MEVTIKNGVVTITAPLEAPVRSSTGKTLLVVKTTTPVKVVGDDGIVYSVALNVYYKPEK